MHIDRHRWLEKILNEFEIHSVCALLGPRQCGKTTLAKHFIDNFSGKSYFFDCENPLHLAQLDSPMTAFERIEGLIVIDEVQLRPDLFPVLRVIVDEYPNKKFLITGSASRDLIHQSSESLAGRIGYHQITPFSIDEIDNFHKLWERGGFPKSYLASSKEKSIRWREQYIQTFLERDLAWLGFNVSPPLMAKLWRMIAHMHGQTVNYHELARSLDFDQRTIKRYLYILEGAFMIQLLRPWHTNLPKREVRAPKVYIRDSGILHTLLSLSQDDIYNSPKLGASFEGFAIEQIIRYFDAFRDCYFWGVHTGAELDLLLTKGGKRIGFEMKYTDSPKITVSMRHALEDLKLDHLYIVIPQKTHFQLEKNITCLGIDQISKIQL